MGFFNARTKKKGNGCPEADTPQVKNPEAADVVIHIVDDARTEKAAMHGKLSRIVRTLGVNGSTIGGYIENVLEEHLRTYGDDINALIRRESSQPL